MKVAVTGATGFVGSHLVTALLRRGDQVTALVRSPARGADLGAAGVTVVRGGLEDLAAIRRLVEGAEMVHHVAGAIAARSEAEFQRINRDGTARLAAAARESGVRRFVYVSSLAVTGPTVPGRPLDEHGPPQPVTAYGRSKQAAEAALARSGVGFTILRPAIVYGPRDRALLRLFRFARRGVAPLLGDGRQELSLVHAADLALAILAAGASPSAAGRIYHVARPEVLTQRDLVQAIARAVGRRVRTVVLPRPLFRFLLLFTGAAARICGRSTVLDPNKAAELLAPAWTCTSEALARDTGWRAEVDLWRGLEETARWYREAGWL